MRTELSMQMPEALEAREVEITAVAVLPDGEYEAVLEGGALPERYMARLNQYSGAVTLARSGVVSEYKALLVLGQHSENGVAVCGQNHISYASVFPGAREWLDRRVGQMADFVADYARTPGRVKTELALPSGRFYDLFTNVVTADNGIGELLLDALKERGEITDATLSEDGFSIIFAPGYGQMAQDTPGGRMTLLALMGCNLEDVHLCHMDEDHDLATIAELNPGTLTAQGKREWGDVLNATVERIYEGHYGLQIGLSGCDAQRLADFSIMLAGYVSTEDYARWVNEGEDIADIPKSHFRSPDATHLIGTFEDLLTVRAQERLTRYDGGYGGYVAYPGVSNIQLRVVYAEALQAIGMSSDAFMEWFPAHRGEAEAHMRDHMLARMLGPGDDVVFIPPAPTGPDGTWQYEAGSVMKFDAEAKNGVVSFEDGEATIPLRHMLARFRGQDFDGSAFGFEQAEPLFGTSESRAEQLLWEAKMEFEGQNPAEEPGEDEAPGMVLL